MKKIRSLSWRARLAGALTLIAFSALATWRYLPRVSADSEANVNWPLYGNDPQNTRYQNVNQITPANASTLTPAWVFHTGIHDAKASMEMSPIVVNGVMYITTGTDDVFALRADTGQQIWHYHPTDMPPLSQLSLCCSENNRGVTFGDGHLYLGRLDATLVSINIDSGVQEWRAVVDDYKQNYSITMAPQFIAGKVVVGVSGGEYGVRGHVDAFNAHNGSSLWRFYTTEPTTWAGASYLKGGAPVWQTPAFDSSLGMLFFSTGNPGPDINGVNRAGTNLYSVSIVALDINSGSLKWYFQEVHHDLWDYDATPPVVLITVNGTPAVAHVGKAGYFYILNRRTGVPLFPVTETPVPTTPAYQNAWPTQPLSSIQDFTPLSVSSVPSGFTAAPQWTPPQDVPLVMQPASEGGSEWPPMAFSPRTGFAYHGTRYIPQVYQTSATNTSGGTFPFWGSTTDDVPGITEFGIYGAVNTATGKVAWTFRTTEPAGSGMAVAGDLLFFGENSGRFNALNAATGARVWTFDGTTIGGGGSNGAPIAYMVNGKEYIANPFGGNPGEADALSDVVAAFALPTRGDH